MAATEEESRRLAEELNNATNALSQFSGMLHGQSATQLEATKADKDAKEAASKFAAKMDAASAAAGALAGVFVNYQKEVYKGSSANKAAAASIDALGEAAKYAGVFLALLVPGGPLVKGLVAGLGLLTSELIKSGKLIAEQTDEIYKAYQDMAKAGAAGAGGMQDVFDSLQKVGLGTEKFGAYLRLVNENANELATFGNTVNKGKKIFDNTMASMSTSQRVQMEQMGLDREAQAEATMGYIKQQRLLTQGTKTQMDTSSAAVMKYIQETDTLTRITGLNRKEQEKLLDDAMRNEAFNATMQEIRETQGEEGVRRVQEAAAMAQKAGPETFKQFQASLSGFVGSSNEAQQAFMATGGKIAEVTDALRSGEIKSTRDTATAMNDLFKAYGETAQQFRGQAKMMNYGSTFGSFYEAVKAGSISIEDLAKAYDEAEAERKKQLADPTTKKAAEAENNVRETQLKQQKLVNLGMDTYISTSHKASEANLALAEAALAAAKWLGKMTGDAERKKTQTLAQAKQTHQTKTQTALEAADKARETAADANATKEQKEKAQKAADLAAAESQQTAREQREAQLREANDRRKKQKAERAAALMKPPAAAPAAPAGGGGGGGGGTSAAPPASGEGAASPSAPATRGLTASPNDLLQFGSQSGSASNFEGLNDRLKTAVINAASEYNSLTGKKIKINSAKRDSEDQERLYQETVKAGRPGIGPHGMPVARPGTSPHEKGQAVDIQNYNDPAAVGAMNRQGLKQTVPNDPVHFQLAMADGGIVPARPGGTRAVIGEGGQDEAVIPLKNGKLPVHIDSAMSFGGHNELKGYNAGAMTTDLAALEKIAGKLGAYDSSTKMITDPKLWKEILQSGMLMNYDMGMAQVGTKDLSSRVGSENVADAIAGRIKELIDTKKDSSEAIAQTRTEFADMMKTFYEDFFAKMNAQQQTENPLDAEMLATLKEISRTNAAAAGASEKMLRYTQN